MRVAAETDWMAAWASKGQDYVPDPAFEMTPELMKELGRDIPDEYLDNFEDAVSLGHAREIREFTLQDLENERKLATLGWKQIPIRMLVGAADPIAAPLTILSGGAAAAGSAGRGAAAARGALAGLATETSIAAVNAYNRPTGGVEDIVLPALLGTALGAGGGAMAYKPEITKVNERLALKAVEAIDEIEGRAITVAPERSSEDKAFDAELADIPGSDKGDAGAAASDGITRPISMSADDTRIEYQNSPKSAFSSVRIDAVGQTKGSDNGIVREIAARLGEDALGNADGSANRISANEVKERVQRRVMTGFYRTATPAFNAWSKRKGLNWYGKARERKAFFEEVTRVIRDPQRATDPEIKQVADALRGLHKELRELAQDTSRLGNKDLAKAVRGFVDVADNPNYIMRRYDSAKIGELYEKFGEGGANRSGGLDRLVAGAIRSANPEIDEALAEKYARWHLKKIRSHAYGQNLAHSRALNGEDFETLREMLLEEIDDLSPDDVDSLISALNKKEVGGHSRSKHRLLMDESFAMKLPRRDGLGFEEVRVDDLFNNDAEELFAIYSRQMSGAIGLANVGFDSLGSLQTMVKHAEQVTPDIDTKQTSKRMQRDMANIEFLATMVSGTPVGRYGANMISARNSKWGDLLRRLRDYNFIRVMNQVGFAQLSEFGNAIGELGWRATLSSMPSLRSFLRDAKTGKIKDETMDQIEAMFGTGAELLRSPIDNRWDEFGSVINPNEGKIGAKVDTALAYGKHMTNIMSGMAYVNRGLQAMTYRGAIQKLLDMAHGQKGWSQQRLADLGLTPEQWENVAKHMRENTHTTDGMLTKRKFRMLDEDGFNATPEGREALADMQNAVFRVARRIVQENDAGNMHRWMGHTIGQMVTQFRSFMLVSWAKQTLRGVRHHDRQAVAAWMLSSLSAGVAYTAQTYVNSFGREDRDEYLEKRMSPESLGKAAFQRAAWASILPMGIDTIVDPFKKDPIFDYRSTSLPSQTFTGNPTFDLIDTTKSAAEGIARGVIDEDFDFSQENARSLISILPFQNMLGVRNFGNAVMHDLPRRSESNF
jgi:hypothetical protein